MNFKLLLLAALFLLSCTGYDRENFRMEVNKKYALKKMPDSAYIDTLDRFFANEPIKKYAKQKAEITMSMDNKAMSLPGKTTGNLPKKTQNVASTPRKTEESKSAESFADQFFNALYKLTENPNDNEFGKKYIAKNGETLDDLLLRIYGAKIKRVPKYLSEDMIKRLNSGTNFSSLSEGEMVLLPIVK